MKLEAKQRLKADELSPKQKAIDFNKNGKVDREDLKNLREGKEPIEAAGRPQWATQILKYFNLLKLHQTTDETKLVFFAEASTYVLGIGLVKIAAILKQHELQISIAPESARAVLVTVEPIPDETKQFMN